MEHESHNESPEQSPDDFRLEELLGTLPPPREAAGLITALLADESRQHILESLSQGEPLDVITARLIAYNLVAHAPDNSTTEHLEDFFLTGYGDHENLRAEYLPLHQERTMPTEGRLLLDSLGTFLFNREHPKVHRPAEKLLASAIVVGTDGIGTKQSVAFAYSGQLDETNVKLLAADLLNTAHHEGEPFRAYLRVPGTDAMSFRLTSDFHASYAGTAADVDSARLLVKQLEGLDWDAVEIGGVIHLFVRPPVNGVET